MNSVIRNILFFHRDQTKGVTKTNCLNQKFEPKPLNFLTKFMRIITYTMNYIYDFVILVFIKELYS